jgi:hypothetical protein
MVARAECTWFAIEGLNAARVGEQKRQDAGPLWTFDVNWRAVGPHHQGSENPKLDGHCAAPAAGRSIV